MTVPFNQIPPDLRVPFFFAEIDASRAGVSAARQRGLVIGQKTAAGTAAANVPVWVSSGDFARDAFGQGSILAEMIDAWRQADSFGELWALPIADDAGGTAATKTITVTAAPTSSGTIPLYVGGRLIRIGVAGGETVNATAALINAAVNATPDLPVTSGVAAAVATLTARNKGTLGNDIDVAFALGGEAAGEALPPGFAATIAAGVAGATDPSIQAALDALVDEPFDFIAVPWAGATELNTLKTFINNRWAWNRQIYGCVFAAKRGSVGTLQSFGTARNDEHISLMGFNGSPSVVWRWAACYAAACAVALRIDPARPVQTLALAGIVAPPMASRFAMVDRNALLFDGVSTFTVDVDGTIRIERAISTWQVNQYNLADTAWLDIETSYTLMAVLRQLRFAVTTNFGRHKLANDDTRFAAGDAIVTPKIVRAFIIAEYAKMEAQGLVENAKAFAANLIVERNVSNPNRLDVLFPPDLVNQLRMVAVLAQFRLQYPAAA